MTETQKVEAPDKLREDPLLQLVTHLARWQPVSHEEDAVTLVERLKRCVGSRDHPLYECEVVPKYFTRHRKDVLFQVNKPFGFARVHLTSSKEENPEFPDTTLFTSLLEWARFEFEDIGYVFQIDSKEIGEENA
jgi:hypothetical protein